MKIPNPQGKGLVPVLDNLSAYRAQIPVPAKHIEQISNELFTSLFILNSQFQFRPVVGKCYWLYQRDGIFRLSMIAPHEWGGSDFGDYIGECQLQADVTWTLVLGEAASEDEKLWQYLQECENNLKESLKNAESVEEVLPVYLQELPFYQRVLASTLAGSLRTSMQLAGLEGMAYEQATALLLPGN